MCVCVCMCAVCVFVYLLSTLYCSFHLSFAPCVIVEKGVNNVKDIQQTSSRHSKEPLFQTFNSRKKRGFSPTEKMLMWKVRNNKTSHVSRYTCL